MNRQSLARFAPLALQFGFMLFSGTRVLALGRMLYPDSWTEAITLLAIAEGAVIGWDVAARRARGTQQTHIAQVMIAVSLLTLGAFVGLEFIMGRKINVGLDPLPVIAIGLSVLAIAHVGAVMWFRHSDPDSRLDAARMEAEWRAQEDDIEAEKIIAREISAQRRLSASQEAAAIAAIRANAFIERQRARHKLAAQSEADESRFLILNKNASQENTNQETPKRPKG